MNRIPYESDLKSTNDDVWAKAVMQCTGGNPYCGTDGFCHADGACFIEQELTLEQALQEIMHLRAELSETRVKCNQVEASHLSLINRLEQSKSIALKNGKSERVFAVKQCLAILSRR